MKALIERWLSRNATAEKLPPPTVEITSSGYKVTERCKGHTYRIRKFFWIEFKQLVHYYY